MKPKSLLQRGRYSLDWIKDFYDQAGVWWGADSEVPQEDRKRAQAINRLGGPGIKRVLELGAGAGHSAAATADVGHQVTAIELSPVRARQALELAKTVRRGSLTILEVDFYTVELGKRFDVVCYWDGFGVGSDSDHRRLLERISHDWLAPEGCALIDIASAFWAARQAGKEERLAPLPGVPGSVEMLRRYHFDPVHCRWIDEWQPVDAPEKTLAQTVRCYTPADFLLLLEGTGLYLDYVEVDGQPLNVRSDEIMTSGPLRDAYSYLVKLVLEKTAQV